MRLRAILLILAIAAVGALAYLNRVEVMRPSPLNLGWTQLEAPLGAVLLGLLGMAVLIGLAAGAAQRAQSHRREQALADSLQSQRDLADRAEASRFTDLRQALDAHLRDTKQREAGISASVEQALMRHQRETRTQLEGLHRAMGSRLGEMEARLEARLDGLLPSRGGWTTPAPASAATQETGEAASWVEPAERVGASIPEPAAESGRPGGGGVPLTAVRPQATRKP